MKYFFLVWCLFFWYEVCSCFSDWTHVPLSNLKQCFFQFGTRHCDAIGFEMLATSVIFITAVKLAILLQICKSFCLVRSRKNMQSWIPVSAHFPTMPALNPEPRSFLPLPSCRIRCSLVYRCIMRPKVLGSLNQRPSLSLNRCLPC